MHTHFLFFYFFYFSVFYFIYFFIYVFGAGPSSAHMGWARPSQPGPVTGPSQWPGWAKATRVRQATRVAALCKWIKIHLHSMLLIIWKQMKGKGSGLPWLAKGDEDDDKAPFIWLNHAWQGTLFTFLCVLLSGICLSFASGYLAYYPGFLRWRNEYDGDAGGSFFYLQEAIKKTVMLMLVFWICCLLLSLFLLCILFSLSLFSSFFFFASPGFFVLSPCMLPLFFLCSALWIFVLCRSWLFFFFFLSAPQFYPFFFVVPLFYRVRSVVTDGMQRDDNIKMSITEVSGWLLPFTAGNGLWLKKKKMNNVLSNDAVLGYEVAICVLTRKVLKVL